MSVLSLAAPVFAPLRAVRDRLWLSRAKHASLVGHPRIALRLARWLPGFSYTLGEALSIDGAPDELVARRHAALADLEARLRSRSRLTLAESARLAERLSDLQLVQRYRVPFPFYEAMGKRLPLGAFVSESDGPRVRDLDGNWSFDLAGSYGVNLFGHDAYRDFIERAVEKASPVGVSLGSYHPVVADNVRRLCDLSGMDEVSFHMSGTEAVMQAVRLARYRTGRRKVVRFVGAYHGFADSVQPGPGNPVPQLDTFTLSELSERTLRVLRSRRDIACVLVNPLQALHPNQPPPADSALVTGVRRAGVDKPAYQAWLRDLRRVCDERSIALVMDEVFLGFRLAKGGAQQYFGVRADLVTYGKTLGGGLPVGVVCGKRPWTMRFREDHPADLCLARGTFNAHPYVMVAMNQFLRWLDLPNGEASYVGLDEQWNARAAAWNRSLELARVPVRVANLVSVFTTTFTQAGRFHWLLPYYLRLEGIALSWVGTGRMIFSHDVSDEHFEEVVRRFTRAAVCMAEDGWFHALDPDAEARVGRDLVLHALRSRFLRRPQASQLLGDGAPEPLTAGRDAP